MTRARRWVGAWAAALALAAGRVGAAAPALAPLKVEGTKVTAGGNAIVLRGVNVASMEWSSDGEGRVLQTIRVAIRDWRANHVRLPLAQDRWFGHAPEQADGGRAYRALVRRAVELCAGLGAYIVLDLHWSNAGVWGHEVGQHAMPDRLSVEFWKSCGREYANHPAVVFDLYNEPHDVSWDVWQNGGTVTENDRERKYTGTFEAVGMQTLLDTVRAAGARNMVIAGGVDWAYDMSGFVAGRQLRDPKGNGVLYANHSYPFKGDLPPRWLAKMRQAAAVVPIIVSEFGSGTGPRSHPPATGDPWVRETLQMLGDSGFHWTAWDMHPEAGPTLISDWSYKPTPGFGVWVQRALRGTLDRWTPDGPAAGVAP